ncbi:hypothetical protein HG264_05785 [Pseudomonas sp. gcc21]|uniref:hypothetical protein n=1 Tax=Pseudomonas sp. gcc21 TaxID=2726989 RepID=UPI00145196F3|nr:hypothetical protein [Pseudomonas sp. gcc21]QJD58453.1 hypothetical protein HG264_05785 [Pseudomonas sp. gcc21]
MHIEVNIYRDRMELISEGENMTVRPATPYSTKRLLVGTFKPAEECLKDGLEKIGAFGFLKRKPTLIMIPCELNDGGMSEVEQRCLTELGLGAGAIKVEVL